MEYHEIGEIIEHDNVKLRVVEYDHDCSTCYFCDNGCLDIECALVIGNVKFILAE